MAEDILLRLQQVHGDMPINEQIYNLFLIIIENKVFTTVEKKLNDFGMISPRRVNKNDFVNEIARELGYNFIALQHQKKPEDSIAGDSSGIAETLLTGGRTAHSVLKLPLNLAHEDSPICNFSKNSCRGRMLRQCKLLVWDESVMSHKKTKEALNRILQDL
ncbi:ATP-dependent DNA helicase [Trichonephila clavipes]|nr:ATP-dependent DNA helicase [Trichonephila clavipes]